MSRKHNQRTRAEILAKRENTQRDIDYGLIQLQPVESRSKYTPHFGAKQEAKLRRQREAAELKLAA